MVDGSVVNMEEFWKERVGRELNRLSMPDATGELSVPGTPRPQTPRLSSGIAGTQMSARFHARFQSTTRSFPDAGTLITTPRNYSLNSARNRTSRSQATGSSRSGRSGGMVKELLGGAFDPVLDHRHQYSPVPAVPLPSEVSFSARRPASSRPGSRPGSRTGTRYRAAAAFP